MIVINCHLLIRVGEFSTKFFVYMLKTNREFLSCWVVKQPPGYVVKGKEDHVWLLIQALYSLKQAGHLWYEKLKSILVKMDFKVSHLDPCVFIHQKNLNTTFISSHVNDLRLFCNSKKGIATIKSEFLKHVKIKDLGKIKTILRIEINHGRSKHTISLSH